ncbi:NlpC/P60 family protein [Agrococcus sp. Ld7]|uniref:NlpC/P60 family protein n=2 Tax=unclassified Agrococcus TaxID=2615065 RepID=UPI003867F590
MEKLPVTTSTNTTSPREDARMTRAAVVRGARRVGVIAIAAAFATPLALPAFAADTGAAQPLSNLSANAQTVAGVVTAGGNGLSDERLAVRATTAEELSQIRAELEAEMEREEQARQAAATATTGTAGSDAAASSGAQSQPAQPEAVAGASGSAIAEAALAQVGISQDCVAMVRRAIAAAGLPYSGMNSLFNLGPTIPMSAASPGDVIYYADGGVGRAHIGIYIGGGRAVHGGWSGFNTVIAGVDIGGSAPVFIDIT